ncbi:MAG: DAK2 domain-containing protein [Firmicutes bacterium]|nr:DAK2 domain-containing protein [Bacillota bacterium]
MIKILNGANFRSMIINAANIIEIHKQHVDSLNVFPVPDGDTGTNMSLTMISAAKEVSACDTNHISDLCTALSKGALRGARGNSGVILSQILKGFATELGSAKEVSVKKFAKALMAGTEVAYKAVTDPKEGTILTVIREMAEFAVADAKKTQGIEDFLEKVIEAGEVSLKKTPDLLPVLKKAGVIDAGGRGLLVIFKGFYNALVGLEETEMAFNDSAEELPFGEIPHFDYADLAEIEFAYCTEFFVVNLKKKTTESDIDKLREALTSIGDSVLVIGDLSMVKVHVHTNEPGVALTYALELGEVDKIKIDNMLEQNRALIGSQKEKLEPFGMVAVCAGEGLSAIFKDLIVDQVVEGGQTMNPSAEDIAKAADKIKAENVFVFPNNKNIILAAEQAKVLSKRNIVVIPTRNVPEGINAVLAYNPENSLQDNILDMNSAIHEVKAGAVTTAVRSANIDDLKINEGDIIATVNSSIVSKGKSVSEVAEELVENLMHDNASNITLYYGSNVDEEQAQILADELQSNHPTMDVGIHFGGQPLYYYIVSIE